jgi:hypothetical protein
MLPAKPQRGQLGRVTCTQCRSCSSFTQQNHAGCTEASAQPIYLTLVFVPNTHPSLPVQDDVSCQRTRIGMTLRRSENQFFPSNPIHIRYAHSCELLQESAEILAASQVLRSALCPRKKNASETSSHLEHCAATTLTASIDLGMRSHCLDDHSPSTNSPRWALSSLRANPTR